MKWHLPIMAGLMAMAFLAYESASAQAPKADNPPPAASASAAKRPAGTGLAMLQLLGMEPLRQQLQLTEQQQDGVTKLIDQYHQYQEQLLVQLQSVPQEQQHEKLAQFQQQLAQRGEQLGEQLDQVLTPQQRDLLEQIRFQVTVYGTMMSNRAVAEQLNLSDQQKQQLQQVYQQVQNEMWKVQQQAAKQVLAILTPEQQQQIRDLQARPAAPPQ